MAQKKIFINIWVSHCGSQETSTSPLYGPIDPSRLPFCDSIDHIASLGTLPSVAGLPEAISQAQIACDDINNQITNLFSSWSEEVYNTMYANPDSLLITTEQTLLPQYCGYFLGPQITTVTTDPSGVNEDQTVAITIAGERFPEDAIVKFEANGATLLEVSGEQLTVSEDFLTITIPTATFIGIDSDTDVTVSVGSLGPPEIPTATYNTAFTINNAAVVAPTNTSCADEIDNNANGLTDMEDPGCQRAENPAEEPDYTDDSDRRWVLWHQRLRGTLDLRFGSPFIDRERSEEPIPYHLQSLIGSTMPQFRLAAGLGSPDDQATIIGRDYPIVGNPVDWLEVMGNLDLNYGGYYQGGTDTVLDFNVGTTFRGHFANDSLYWEANGNYAYNLSDPENPNRFSPDVTSHDVSVGGSLGGIFSAGGDWNLALTTSFDYRSSSYDQGGFYLEDFTGESDRATIGLRANYSANNNYIPDSSLIFNLIPYGGTEVPTYLQLDSMHRLTNTPNYIEDQNGSFHLALSLAWNNIAWQPFGSFSWQRSASENFDNANVVRISGGIDGGSSTVGRLEAGLVFGDNITQYYNIDQSGGSLDWTPDIANYRPFTFSFELITLNQGDSKTSVPGGFVTIHPMEFFAPRPEDQ